MKLLDLYCKAGGASRGYVDAGFDVEGVDIEPQKRYPYKFIQASALDILADRNFLAGFDVIHASPPCKVATSLKPFSAKHHVDLIPQTRELLEASGKPYVIENVPGAELLNPVILCGSMFPERWIERHRLFEFGGVARPADPACDHARQRAASPGFWPLDYHDGFPRKRWSPVVGVYGRGQGLGPGEVEIWKKVMGIDWMIKDEMSQAVPPDYTRWIGRHFLDHLS